MKIVEVEEMAPSEIEEFRKAWQCVDTKEWGEGGQQPGRHAEKFEVKTQSRSAKMVPVRLR